MFTFFWNSQNRIIRVKKNFHGTPQYEYGPFVPPSCRTISLKISKNLQMCVFFGILGMGLSNEQCENCLVKLVALYVNCVLKLQFCFAFDANFVTIYGTIFLFLELSVPLQEKKLQSSTIAVNINVGLLNQEWKKNQGVWYLWQFQAWICQKKRGKQKFLSFTHISQWPPPKKKDKKPNPNSVYKLSEQGEVPQEY